MAPWGTPHTMEQGDEEEDRLARAVAGLTGRLETIVVLIPRSDRKSPVDAEEYQDRPYRRPSIGSAKRGQTNLSTAVSVEW